MKLRILALSAHTPMVSQKNREILMEQLINSAIVAGIAAVATWTGVQPDFLVMLKAFTITFLIELRKFRRIK